MQHHTDFIPRHPTNRIPEELTELIADVLLASEQGDSERPAYREDQIARKQRRAAQAEEHFLMSACAGRSLEMTPEDDRTWEAALTSQQKAACDMIEEGLSVTEIAGRLEIARTTVLRLLRQVAYRASVSDCAYRGLSEVYHSEVHRRLYRRPRHCSTRPCRKLGYCKFAAAHPVTGTFEELAD